MDTEPKQSIESIPAFDAFRNLLVENIGYFPTFHYDRNGLAGHRMRIFRTPPAADIRYSERALVRYICLADIITLAVSQNRAELLTSGLCLLAGGELLRHNKFAGLAFIASAFRDHNFVQLGPRQVIDTAIRAAHKQVAWRAVVNLLFPLAHEIGHLPESQKLCPAAIHSDAIYETYSINFEQVRGFTGNFDYRASLLNAESPLNLPTLRQEVASDFFAVAAMTHLPTRCASSDEVYPLDEIVAGILTFPLVMGAESMALKWGAGKLELQDITLAMHCRYSVIIDSIRASIKAQFRGRQDVAEVCRVIDSAVDHNVSQFDSWHLVVWDAFLDYFRLCQRFAQHSIDDILQMLRESRADARRSLAIASHLEMLADDVHGYSIDPDNHKELHEFSLKMKTFDTIVLRGRNALLLN
ncbi:hypothetical protein [Planctopirus hydrillae]|uniref:Uncharacterized protein n=1 Tax=Planctopirus hydrillae TaxID=1841610 RepID=A0A1C3E4L4_9PLAN|nr:hypothetical protein [Planctopirus hydrillae]ODA28186.1 hypothetical protein A6X21_13515 [Planctopirus hydrillae]